MFTVRFASIFLLCATLVSATPVPAAPLSTFTKRGSTGCVAVILTNAINAEGAPLDRIAALARAHALTDATVTPFVNAVVKVLEAATAVLVALPAAANLKRHTDAETANAVFDLVIGVTERMEDLLASASTIPSSVSLLASVDSALNQVLVTVDSLLPGVLGVAVQSLAANTFIPNLQGVDFQLTLATFGIPSPMIPPADLLSLHQLFLSQPFGEKR
ncbi:hypothetical protein C8J57DRAFT_1518979 [Mycena rebaudengoi]|nr:hypothetical protein C8J57DRAFT_1518979 [Mycena rebaudengoi]